MPRDFMQGLRCGQGIWYKLGSLIEINIPLIRIGLQTAAWVLYNARCYNQHQPSVLGSITVYALLGRDRLLVLSKLNAALRRC